jgi:hypothetical protein
VSAPVPPSRNIPGQASPIKPVLQAQDGTFIGTVGIGPSPGTVTQTNMIGFGGSGNVKWSVPNDYPQIATADGGVIGGSGITYDANGNANGQLGNMPAQSWIGKGYQVGSVESVAFVPINLATSFWAIYGGNRSSNNTAVQQDPFAQLDTCSDPTFHPPLICPGPEDAIFHAWWNLKSRLSDSATRKHYLDNYVFVNQANGHTAYDRNAFVGYLGLGAGPEFYDGERSTVKLSDAECGGNPGWTVQHLFQTSNNQTVCDVAAATCRLDPKQPQRTFFEPRAISFDSQGVTDANIALEFHEALHGFTQMDDPNLQSFLGCTSGFSDTRDITIYLLQFVGQQPPNGTPMTCKYVEQHKMPGNNNQCVR